MERVMASVLAALASEPVRAMARRVLASVAAHRRARPEDNAEPGEVERWRAG